MNDIGLGTKLYKLRKEKKRTLQQVADFLGVNKSSVSRWENGETSRIRKSTISSLASYYNVPFSFLYPEETDDSMISASQISKYVPNNSIPILGKISAGLPLYAEENLEGYTKSDKNDGNEYFALRVNGDSMNAARIENGDLLIIRKQSWVENGEIAAVMVGDNDATVKKFYYDKATDTVMLIPMSTNPKHQIQVYNTKDTNIMVLGKVVENKINFI